VSRPPEILEVIVSPEANGDRLDRYLAGALSVSRSELQRWIAEGRVTVRGAALGASARVRNGDRVLVDRPPPAISAALPESAVIVDVIHVDDDLVIVNKPAGLVVHPARGHEGGTLVNGLLALGLFSHEEFDDVSGRARRPGIVHRLDKGTSGLMVVARTATARDLLGEQFRAHSVERAYEAIVVGEAKGRTFNTRHGRHPRDRLRFTTHVRTGKPAITHVRMIARLYGTTHVECTLETGRTHQIRVHLAESGTPLLGDALYGKAPRDERVRAVGERLGHQALHARVLGFVHPRTGKRVRFEIHPPEDFADALGSLSM
jgi:23S rRNA pseudouridine1911/1915/1917 synthase